MTVHLSYGMTYIDMKFDYEKENMVVSRINT